MFLQHIHFYPNSPFSGRYTQSKMNDIRISHWLITWHKMLFDPEKLSRNNFWSYIQDRFKMYVILLRANSITG